MTTRRPHLPGAPITPVEPVVVQQRDGSDDVRHVPAGLDSRGFALHRIFCMAGEPSELAEGFKVHNLSILLDLVTG